MKAFAVLRIGDLKNGRSSYGKVFPVSTAKKLQRGSFFARPFENDKNGFRPRAFITFLEIENSDKILALVFEILNQSLIMLYNQFYNYFNFFLSASIAPPKSFPVLLIQRGFLRPKPGIMIAVVPRQ